MCSNGKISASGCDLQCQSICSQKGRIQDCQQHCPEFYQRIRTPPTPTPSGWFEIKLTQDKEAWIVSGIVVGVAVAFAIIMFICIRYSKRKINQKTVSRDDRFTLQARKQQRLRNTARNKTVEHRYSLDPAPELQICDHTYEFAFESRKVTCQECDNTDKTETQTDAEFFQEVETTKKNNNRKKRHLVDRFPVPDTLPVPGPGPCAPAPVLRLPPYAPGVHQPTTPRQDIVYHQPGRPPNCQLVLEPGSSRQSSWSGISI